MTERTTVSITNGGQPMEPPLVLHVIPTTLARGAQLEARALADRLDAPGERVHRLLSLFEGPEEVVSDFSLGHRGKGTPGVGFDPRLAGRLRTALARFDPDVVVAHGSEPLKYVVPAMAGRRRPLIYYAIGTYSGSSGSAQQRLWKFLMGRADLVAAEGTEVLEECVARFGMPSERVALAPNGRDPQVFFPPERDGPSDPPLVIFVGALTGGKRPDRFVEVVAGLRDRGIPLRAELIGDGPLRVPLEERAESAGVELRGSRSDIADQMRRADVLVFCSSPAGEGMPGVLIEAGMSGLPVVTTDVPGVTSIVEDTVTGFVVGIDDLPAAVSAAARLIDEPRLRSTMGHAAREHCVDRFSLSAVSARWLTFIEPLIGTTPHRRSR
jgi:glycosyltransferase involved in cell wall biosynthesis